MLARGFRPLVKNITDFKGISVFSVKNCKFRNSPTQISAHRLTLLTEYPGVTTNSVILYAESLTHYGICISISSYQCCYWYKLYIIWSKPYKSLLNSSIYIVIKVKAYKI